MVRHQAANDFDEQMRRQWSAIRIWSAAGTRTYKSESVYDQSYTGKNPIYVKKWSISISFKNTLFQKQQRDHTEVLEIFHLFIKTHRKHEPATKELETQTPKSD